MTDGEVNEAWTYASIVGHFVGERLNHLICGNLSQVRGRINTHTQKLQIFNGYTEQGVKTLQCKSIFFLNASALKSQPRGFRMS